MSLIKTTFFILRDKRMLSWIPDRVYLAFYYRLITGNKLNITHPELFTEKLQWIKLYDRNPEYTIMADKYLAKEYVAKKIGDEYIIPLLGVWDRPSEIPFDTLPNKFVLKTTHDSGGVMVVDKQIDFDRNEIMSFLQIHLDRDLYERTREWPYKGVKHRIIAEKCIENSDFILNSERGSALLDYKFYCFNGEPKFLYVGYANMKAGKKHDQLSFFDLNWETPPFYRSDHDQLPFPVNKPEKFDEMIDISKKLSSGIPFVRVDLFYAKKRIYFSELTFSPGSGFARFEPIEWEKRIGEWITLPMERSLK